MKRARRTVCTGGIIGLGEAEEDRVGLLHTLATLPEHPESVPINALLAVKGTPLENQKVVRLTSIPSLHHTWFSSRNMNESYCNCNQVESLDGSCHVLAILNSNRFIVV